MNHSGNSLSRKKVLVILVLSFFASLVLYFIIGSIDAPEQSHTELEPPAQKVLNDDENALPELIQVEKFLESKDFREILEGVSLDLLDVHSVYHPDHEFDEDAVKKILKDNAKALPLIDSAFAKKSVYQPYKYRIDESSQYLVALNAAQLVEIRFHTHVHAQDWDACLHEITTLRDVAREFYLNETTIVGLLIGSAIDTIQQRMTNHLLNQQGLPDTCLKPIMKLLTPLFMDSLRTCYVKAMKGEFTAMKNMVKNDLSGAQKVGFLFHPNRTCNMFADVYLAHIKAASLRPSEITGYSEAYTKNIKFDWYDWVLPNVLGKRIHALTSPLLMKQISWCYLVEAHNDLLMLKTAARMYYAENGNAAPDLASLQPFLPRKLYDPFAAKPEIEYQYSLKHNKVSSVGMNFMPDPNELGDTLFFNNSEYKEIQLELFRPKQ